MFVDKATVTVIAGNGGNGCVSFRHEKFIDKGGPDGGDGGDGGSVLFVAEHNVSSLAKFRYAPILEATSGVAGAKQKKKGAKGSDLIVAVPVGTVVAYEGRTIADFTQLGQKEVIAKGGKGGFGNAHFTSSRRQVPRFAEKGEPGDKLELSLELKMLADVGLVGLPNAGKSTFLSVVSNARPEIADYPFTTLVPHLGVVDVDGESLLVADIPGLIEGASQGKGLGDEFLRHVERTKVLLHLVDGLSNDVKSDYLTIQKELHDYHIDLSTRAQIVVLTKTDALDADLIAMQQKELRAVVPKAVQVMSISSKQPASVKEVLRALQALVVADRSSEITVDEAEVPIYDLTPDVGWVVTKLSDGYRVTGEQIERFAKRTDFDNPDGVARLRDILRKQGVVHELERQGVTSGDIIYINHYHLEY